jgi:hypothetical protein
VSLCELDVSNTDSILNLIRQADTCLQYEDSREPNSKAFEQAEKYLNN